MDYIQLILLGIIQGLTEFIPISSTAHLRIIPALLGWQDPGTALSAVLQLGTLASVLWYFRHVIYQLALAAWWSIWRSSQRTDPQARMAWRLVVGNLPIVVLGLWGRHFIETEARSLIMIGIMLIVVALALAVAESRPCGKLDGSKIGWRRTMLIGLFQSLALLPGASRSGSAILGGMLVGLSRTEAAKFSFLLGIPAILGSGLLQLPQAWQALSGQPLPLLTALLVAAVSGHLAIGWLLAYLKNNSTLIFIFYRVGLGIMVLLLVSQGLR